jgi:hypothetical protein
MMRVIASRDFLAWSLPNSGGLWAAFFSAGAELRTTKRPDAHLRLRVNIKQDKKSQEKTKQGP